MKLLAAAFVGLLPLLVLSEVVSERPDLETIQAQMSARTPLRGLDKPTARALVAYAFEKEDECASLRAKLQEAARLCERKDKCSAEVYQAVAALAYEEA